MESRLFIVEFVSIFFKAKKLWMSNSCFFILFHWAVQQIQPAKLSIGVFVGWLRFVIRLFFPFSYLAIYKHLFSFLSPPLIKHVFLTLSVSVLHISNIDFPNPLKAESVTSMMFLAATDLENRRAKVAMARRWFPTLGKKTSGLKSPHCLIHLSL